MISCDSASRIEHLQRSYVYHLEQACLHDEMLDWIDNELDQLRSQVQQDEAL